MTISGGTTEFLGFFVQARLMADDTQFTGTGTFATVSGNSRLSSCTPPDVRPDSNLIVHNCHHQHMHPFFIPQSGVTHSSRVSRTSVMFSWTAPAAGTGPIRFG